MEKDPVDCHAAARGVVVLGAPGEATNILVNALLQRVAVARVILEDRPPRRQMLLRRVQRLGLITTIGQILFQLAVVPWLRREAIDRRAQIIRDKSLDPNPFPSDMLEMVRSVNSRATTEMLRDLDPAVVIISGTRILSSPTLTCIPAPFINVHAGFTPRYRGVHGAYWALATGDRAACGVTVHLVDRGIDTGPVLYRSTIQPGPADNFVTYPLLQLAEAIPLLLQAVADVTSGSLGPTPCPDRQSRLWTHPTMWGYIWRRASVGVR